MAKQSARLSKGAAAGLSMTEYTRIWSVGTCESFIPAHTSTLSIYMFHNFTAIDCAGCRLLGTMVKEGEDRIPMALREDNADVLRGLLVGCIRVDSK
jgi:hypothetical protein